MIDQVSSCNLFAAVQIKLFPVCSAISSRLLTQKTETLAVHSFVTVDNSDKMEFKECAKMTGLCSAGHI